MVRLRSASVEVKSLSSTYRVVVRMAHPGKARHALHRFAGTIGRMDHLDGVDLTLKLSSKEEARRLERGGRRLQQLRLTCAGLIGDQQLGPPLCVLFEG